MYIDEGFVKYTNTKWEALKLTFGKRSIGHKMWFLHQYCLLTNKEPKLQENLENLKENNIEFFASKRKVKLSNTGYCYGWEGTYYVSDIKLTDEQNEEIKLWYRRIKARKDSKIVEEENN